MVFQHSCRSLLRQWKLAKKDETAHGQYQEVKIQTWVSYSAIDLQESKHKSYIYMYMDAAERVMKLLDGL